MKELIVKIFRLLDLPDPAETLSADEAIKAIASRMDEIARGGELDAPAAAALVHVAGVTPGTSVRGLVEWIRAKKERSARECRMLALGVEELIALALEQEKIRPDEVEWLRDRATENLAVAEAFVKYRRPHLFLGEHSTATKPAGEVDAPQAAMNRRLGVSEAVYKKYSS